MDCARLVQHVCSNEGTTVKASVMSSGVRDVIGKKQNLGTVGCRTLNKEAIVERIGPSE